MPLLSVISDTPGAGKTGVAAAVARALAYTGRRVWLVRGEGDGNAAADAHWFASLEFAPGSASTPVAPGVIPPPSGDEVVVAELDAPLERADATILVTRGLPDEARVAELAPAAVVALDVPAFAQAGAPDESWWRRPHRDRGRPHARGLQRLGSAGDPAGGDAGGGGRARPDL